MRHQNTYKTSPGKALVTVKSQESIQQRSAWLPVMAALAVSVLGMAVVYGLESYFGMTQSYGLESVFKIS